VSGELSLLAYCGSTARVQRISDCVKIQNTVLIPDKVLNVNFFNVWITPF